MKILITGATGLVGTALAHSLVADGHVVCRLVRPGQVQKDNDRAGFDVSWNPATGELGGAAVGADAVVNLAGASVAKGRWTPERKALLHSSRIDTTRALVQALAQMNARPRVLISASATGYYGNRGDEILRESTQPGQDFLGKLAVDWEAEASKAEALGIRVVLLRFGIILAKQGGALPQMMTPFKLGLGGKLGDGKQWIPWITLIDVIGIIKQAIANSAMRGPFNTVSPEPVRNAAFTQALADAMHRPAIFSAPAFALRLAMGEMADALLGSQRAIPANLSAQGYRFEYPEINAALRAVLAK